MVVHRVSAAGFLSFFSAKKENPRGLVLFSSEEFFTGRTLVVFSHIPSVVRDNITFCCERRYTRRREKNKVLQDVLASCCF